jgi:hypothetical protein
MTHLLDKIPQLTALPNEVDAGNKFYAMCALLQMHLMASLLAWTLPRNSLVALTISLLGLAGLILILTRRYIRLAFALTATMLASEYLHVPLAMLPALIANHNVLELLCLLVLAVCHATPSSRDLALRTLRGITAIVLFHSGVQKLLAGTYFSGQYLAWLHTHEPRYANVFKHLISAGDLTRLESLRQLKFEFTGNHLTTPITDAYHVTSLPLVLLSNFVWIAEIALAAGLLIPRIRVPATLAALALMACIQLGAHEVFFAALMSSLLLLFLRRDINRLLLPAFALFYALVVADGITHDPVGFGR